MAKMQQRKDISGKPIAETCTRCGKPLNPKATVWLELDQRDNSYHDFKDVPADKSQGWFAFGRSCSYAQLHEARSTRRHANADNQLAHFRG